MSRFSILLSRSIFAGIAAILATSTAAHAESQSYSGVGFTVTFTSDDKGYHYQGCDAKNNCIYLPNGERWRDRGVQGVGWFTADGKYTYSISHQEGNSILLVVAQGTKTILRRKLYQVTTKVSMVDLKLATTCKVINIQSGQLALRSSPGGESLAGLDNGNSVLPHIPHFGKVASKKPNFTLLRFSKYN